MCSQRGIANVLREVIEARTQRLDELRIRKTAMDEAIVTMEQLLDEDTNRLKEVEGRNEQP